jgi:hypothetical protein
VSDATIASTRDYAIIRFAAPRSRIIRGLRYSRPSETSIKEAAFAVMEEAYLKASAGGTLPANARQIMYAARPLVLARTKGKCWGDSAYFTQTLLPDFVEQHAEETAD